jgi:predicted nuclease of restriction endonuclease-like (RecB) superfamily
MLNRRRPHRALKESGAGYSVSPIDYARLLDAVKSRIRSAQLQATLAVNRELILLYWEIGRLIVERQKSAGWGRAVVEHLSRDIRKEFPALNGFSPQNLWYMRAFYLAWSEPSPILQQAVGEKVSSQTGKPTTAQSTVDCQEMARRLVSQIPWGHNIILIEKLKGIAERLWYLRGTIENGWSRNVLALQIESRLHERQGKALTNFTASLPPPLSDLAQQSLKDPYIFDFLTLSEQAREKDLELGLLGQIQKFMLEMGVGFAFVGRQFHLEVGGMDYYLDLLFYHLKLRCFVVVDLKARRFMPEDAGKMNFYLSAVDDQLRHPDDKPTIGLLLCREKDGLSVEYALRDLKKPVGVAAWKTRFVESLPKDLRDQLPSVAEIEAELKKSSPIEGSTSEGNS